MIGLYSERLDPQGAFLEASWNAERWPWAGSQPDHGGPSCVVPADRLSATDAGFPKLVA